MKFLRKTKSEELLQSHNICSREIEIIKKNLAQHVEKQKIYIYKTTVEFDRNMLDTLSNENIQAKYLGKIMKFHHYKLIPQK